MPITRRSLSLATVSAGIAVTTPTLANDRAVIETFYTHFLTAAGPKDKAAIAATILAPDWKSFGDYSGKFNTRDGLTKMLGGFHHLMPDLTWAIEEVITAGDRHIVRGRASGTPKGPLFGVDGKGKSFTILSIDIHRVANGRIVESWHVEDWSGALRQLSAS